MAVPQAPEARPFFRSAKERLVDAQLLLDGNRTTGAIYLAGYAVECILKALILNAVPRGKRQAALDSFTGTRGYDLRWLRRRYHEEGGPSFEPEVVRDFLIVTDWNTALRYRGATAEPNETKSFLDAVERLMKWAEGRF